jgi:hypothetical protein
MSKAEAYKIVLEDIMNTGCGFFVGSFDAKNGNKHFMYGIETVMELIALNSSKEDYKKFCEIFSENFQKSLDKAEQK